MKRSVTAALMAVMILTASSVSLAVPRITDMAVYSGGSLLGFHMKDTDHRHAMRFSLTGSGGLSYLTMNLDRGLVIRINGSGRMDITARPSGWRSTVSAGHLSRLYSGGAYYSFTYFQGKISKIAFRGRHGAWAYGFSYFQGKLSRVAFTGKHGSWAYDISYFQGKVGTISHHGARLAAWKVSLSYFQGLLGRISYTGRPHAFAYEMNYYQGRISLIRYRGRKSGSAQMTFSGGRITGVKTRGTFGARVGISGSRHFE